MAPVIRIADLWKRYNDEEHGIALRGANLEVHAGDIVALFGKSGSGKTTLLNLLAGLDRPTSGTIEIEGRNLEVLGEKGRTEFRRNRLGFVFQFFNLLPTLTALENVLLTLQLANIHDSHLAMEALAAVGLAGKDRRYPQELSGGEQQRVAIARAIAKRPAIILADEPTGNLDTFTGIQILDLLVNQCHNTRTTLIMVSHALVTCRYADRILRMVDGVLTEEPSCDGLVL